MKRLKRWLRRAMGMDALEGRLDDRLKQLESLVQVGVDVHVKGESWAVFCIAGKPEYVKFRRLRQQDARQLFEWLKHLELNHADVVADLPMGFSDWRL